MNKRSREKNREYGRRQRSKPGYKEKYNAYKKMWKARRYALDIQRVRLGETAYRYRMKLSELEALYSVQNNRCAICNKESKLSVDHDHTTGRVRALLCSPCNSILGYANDDVARLRSAIAYLERYST